MAIQIHQHFEDHNMTRPVDIPRLTTDEPMTGLFLKFSYQLPANYQTIIFNISIYAYSGGLFLSLL